MSQYDKRWPNGRNQFGVTEDDVAELREQLLAKHSTESSNVPQKCEICGYDAEPTDLCPSCNKQLCGDCHNAHADDIACDGECHPELI